MTQGFEVTNVQRYIVRRGRAMPILASGKVETRETREVVCPAMARGVHGQGEIAIMLQEGDSVPEEKGLLPPFEVLSAGLINENRDLYGGGEPFCGKNSTSEESTRSNHIRSIEKFPSQ